MAAEYDRKLKILLIGEANVGKSCLVLRYADFTFLETPISTIGVDFKVKTIEDRGQTIRLEIWDVAGKTERSGSVADKYYKDADGIIFCYDITSDDSFARVRHWWDQVDRHAPEHVVKLLAGTKSDLDDKRKVSRGEAEGFAEVLELPFVETSAKTSDQVEECFLRLVREILQKKPASAVSTTAAGLSVSVQLMEGRNLKAADSNGLSDPYAKLKLNGQKFKSKTVKKNLSPVWGETFLATAKSAEDKLIVHVWDHDTLSRDDPLGHVEVSLASITPGTPHEQWYNLVDGDAGRIRLIITITKN